jgi:hypothetical protein
MENIMSRNIEEDDRRGDPQSPSSPHGPHRKPVDQSAGGADSSPYENLSSEERHEANQRELERHATDRDERE